MFQGYLKTTLVPGFQAHAKSGNKQVVFAWPSVYILINQLSIATGFFVAQLGVKSPMRSIKSGFFPDTETVNQNWNGGIRI